MADAEHAMRRVSAAGSKLGGGEAGARSTSSEGGDARGKRIHTVPVCIGVAGVLLTAAVRRLGPSAALSYASGLPRCCGAVRG